MLQRFNSDLSFETALISSSDFQYRVYIMSPFENLTDEPFIYVTNGKKKKHIFYDRLVRINKYGVIDKCKNLKIPPEDINKFIKLINLNYDVICKCWKKQIGNGTLEKGKNFKWEW